MSVTRINDTEADNLTLQSKVKFGTAVRTLSGALTLTVNDAMVQKIDPGGATRVVTLPAEASCPNQLFLIINDADAAEDLTVKDDAAATIATVSQDEGVFFHCDGTAWRAIISQDPVGGVAVGDVSLNRGSVMIGASGNVGAAVDAKASGKILVGDGTDLLSVAVSGDVSLAANGAVTIATVGGLATAAEVNRVADVSTRVVNLAVSTAITELAHDGKVIVMGGAGAARTFTLPVPVAGMKFRFVVGEVNTSNYLIKSVAGTQVMCGSVMVLSDNSAAVVGFTAGATDDTITLDGTTTGGVAIGDWIELTALSTTKWAVSGQLTASGTEATPFSDTVA
jgi:hypothetical protein